MDAHRAARKDTRKMGSADRFGKVEELYHAALERTGAERRAFLDSACAGDPALRREVESLLGYEDQAGTFLEQPAVERVAPAPTLHAGLRLGSYEIVSLVDAGGMGEVYRARDERLARNVAVKVLPTAFLAPDRVARFEREARAAGALNHPNVLTVHDVGSHEGAPYLVTELLDGRTLRDRLRAGPLPLRKAVDIAMQLARGLAAAHEKRIVHRDLKPANVFLTEDGRAKILDFGLAHVLEPIAPEGEARTKPARLTGATTLLGTIAYMSPEQARHAEVDARSDVFSLGAVLYEMLAGRRAFEGATAADTLSAILHEDPAPIRTADRLLPPALDRIVRRCLEKEVGERFQSARDVAFALEALSEASGEAAGETSPAAHRRDSRVTVLAAALAIALGALALLSARTYRRDAPPSAPSHRTSVLPPPGVSFAPGNYALSPDGTRLAFVGVGPEGQSRLWVRSLDARVAQEMKETLNSESPFWAPDSRRLGFFGEGKLKVVDTSTGAIQVLGDAPSGRGATWSRAGVIVFAPNLGGPLFSISERGGPAKVVTSVDPESGKSHRWPWFLPDGQHFLYLQDWGIPGGPRPNGIYAGSLAGGEPKLLSTEISGSVYFASGQLLYLQDGSLMAQPFDPERWELSGSPSTVFGQELEKDEAFSHVNLSLSENGVAIFQSLADAASELVWYDRGGRELGRVPHGGLSDPQLSPDGRFLAATSDDGRNGRTIIRVLDLGRGVSFPLTSGGQERMPTWSPDGTTIAYRSGTWPRYGIAQVRADGTGQPSVLFEGPKMMPNDFLPDGRALLYMRLDRSVAYLARYDLAERTSRDLQGGGEFQVSPDGRWLAGLSMRFGLIVEPFPGPGPVVQISSEGGTQPRWRGDGQRLFFVAPDRKLMAVDIDVRGDHLQPSAPRALFQTRIVAPAFVLFQYDVTADGERFLVNSLKPEAPLTLVSNWPRALRR
jgi:eukaryotic-like serine/threonine-protein kinase